MWQWKEKARAAECETQRLQSVVTHLEHAARAQELTLEQLKGRLSDKVTKEERLARRDADAYARLKRAFLANKGLGIFCKAIAQKMHAHACLCRKRTLTHKGLMAFCKGIIQKGQLRLS